ncbi:hypothetical protein Q8A67_001850 [Cirrhinus molitorella]|nr:hypothetical protein Q8A67_001850 [Cirrhinus molitorella]
MMKEMMKTMCPVVKRDKSIDTPLEFSREGIRAGLFVNKHQLKTALEREWNHQEAVDVFRIQHRKEMLDVCG